MKRAKRASQEIKRDRNGLPRCRVCGCTDAEACEPPCGWAPGEEDLCTSCHATVMAIVAWAGGAHRAIRTALMREASAQMMRVR